MSAADSPDRLDLSKLPIAEVREHLRRAEVGATPAALRALRVALASDRRAGVRQLAERLERRLAAAAQEARRLAQLFALRDGLVARGARAVAGVDEVGVGPLAGPVVAAAVILPSEVDLPGLNDSKKLSPVARQRLDEAIRKQAVAFAIGRAEPAEIDRLNILNATLEAMRRAVHGLALAADHLLVDARRVPGVSVPQTPIVNGDAVDGSIAAASIIAKVHRDGLMEALDRQFPGYGLARHKGYGTAEHLEALQERGATPIHRQSFAPVAAAASR